MAEILTKMKCLLTEILCILNESPYGKTLGQNQASKKVCSVQSYPPILSPYEADFIYMLEKVFKGSVPSQPKAIKKVTHEILALTDSNAQPLVCYQGY